MNTTTSDINDSSKVLRKVDGVVYLASHAGSRYLFDHMCRLAGRFRRMGYDVYSPVVHGGKNAELMLSLSEELWVVLTRWEDSLAGEISSALEMDKPIYYVDLLDITAHLEDPIGP